MPVDSFGPAELHGEAVWLVPLQTDHAAALEEAAADGALWRLPYTAVAPPGRMAAEIDRRLELQRAGSMIPFAVVQQPGGRVVGMTTYLGVDRATRRVEIGYTWYAASVQRSGLNTEAKYLLLRHAFEVLHCVAVEFRAHSLNQPSRRAIERLGAKLDGILRSHMIAPNGTLRDTAVYSITAVEWPAVKAHLEWLRISRGHAAA